MKFIKRFLGATGGNAYPVEFNVGDECPDDLVNAATAAGALEMQQSEKADGAAKAKPNADKA